MKCTRNNSNSKKIITNITTRDGRGTITIVLETISTTTQTRREDQTVATTQDGPIACLLPPPPTDTID